MLKHFRTLRFKLAALYLAVFGVIQTALCVGILVSRERHLWRDFDRALMERAETLAEAISGSIAASHDPFPNDAIFTFLNTQRFSGYFVQVSLPEGGVIHRTPNLGDCTLPLEPAPKDLDPSDPVVVTTLTDDAARRLGGTSGLRFLTHYERQPGKQNFNLELARGLDIMDQRIAALRRVFIVAIPLGLIASAAASLFVARRSLAPLGKIAREAQALTVSDLHRRIETHAAGDEVAEMVNVINGMLDRLEAAFRAQEHFIADVSHELKTPLAVLIGEAQVLLQRDRSREDHLRFVASVQDELQRLTRIVHSLLMLARADAGLPLSHALPLSVNEIVADSVRRCDQSARERQVMLVPHIAMPDMTEAPPMVLGDADLLGAVIDNLIRNSIRFSPPDGRVEVSVSADLANVCVKVSDKGPGIAPEYLEKVFGRFFHLPGGDERIRGTGLGLAIARGMVELHRGTVHAVSPDGGGCELVVQLPRHVSATLNGD